MDFYIGGSGELERVRYIKNLFNKRFFEIIFEKTVAILPNLPNLPAFPQTTKSVNN